MRVYNVRAAVQHAVGPEAVRLVGRVRVLAGVAVPALGAAVARAPAAHAHAHAHARTRRYALRSQ